MNGIGLMEAWRLWLAGKSVSTLSLWGLEILWWGRVGKMVQFAAALTIVAEIIGPERLRNFGNSLHSAFTLRKADEFARDALRWILVMWRYFFALPGSTKEKEALAASKAFKADNLNFIVGLFVTGIGVVLVWPLWQWWLILLAAAAGYFALLVTLSPIVTVIFVLLYTLSGILIDLIVIEPLAWMLERRNIDKWIKIVAILFIFLGFHFDLLAS